MKNLFKLKFKMHKLVNIIFYLIIFVVGFIIGFTTNKINISDIISQVLFIDNVKAYTILNAKDDNTLIDEEYIYNLFSTNENFDINEFNHIYCEYNGSASTYQYINCYAFRSIDDFYKLDYEPSDYDYYDLTMVEQIEHFYLKIEVYKYKTIRNTEVKYNSLPLNTKIIGYYTNSTYNKVATNFDIGIYGQGSNLLDFSSYITPKPIITNNFVIFQDDNITIDTEYVYNTLFNDTGYSIEDYPYIIVDFGQLALSSGNDYTFDIFAAPSLNDFTFEKATYNNSDFKFKTSIGNNVLRASITFEDTTGSIKSSSLAVGKFGGTISFGVGGNGNPTNTKPKTYSNFDIDSKYTDSSSIINVLDFGNSNADMVYNKNLFESNEDFKYVCIEEDKPFAITRSTPSEIDDYFDYDYIWFPYGVNGLNKYIYDSTVEDKIAFYNEEFPDFNYWFKNKELIDIYFDSEIPGDELKAKGYTDKYSFYGWSSHYFIMYFENQTNRFTIFEFDDPTSIHISSSGNEHGGGGSRLDFDEEVEELKEYCFYIKNEYEVQYLNIDEFNDYYGEIITPNGTINITTEQNKNNISNKGLMSQVNDFINEIKNTLNFIGDNVYQFYLSLPVLLRSFLISILVILIVKFIIGMVVK